MQFKVKSYFEESSLLMLDLSNTKLIIGSFFQEQTFIRNIFKDKMILDSQQQEDKHLAIKNIITDIHNIEELEDTMNECKAVIITNLEDAVCWPYIIKKLCLSYKFISTEPIIQILKYYLKEFYDIFNKLMISYDDEQSIIIDEQDITSFSDSIIKLNYNEKYSLESYMKVSLQPSGYSLGSSNVLIEYFDKKVVILSKISTFEHRYPKLLDISNLKDCDLLINMPFNINYHSDYINQLSRFVENIYKITSSSNVESYHNPTIFLPTDPLFILDIVDLLRYKISIEVKSICISKFIKSVIDYSNVSHGFINSTIHNKIYEFKLPFNFDELVKNSNYYNFNI